MQEIDRALAQVLVLRNLWLLHIFWPFLKGENHE
jgi:hypothetical protein